MTGVVNSYECIPLVLNAYILFKRSSLLRFIGVAILGILLWQLDTYEIIKTLTSAEWSAEWSMISVAFLLNVPQMFIKTSRWRLLLRSQEISYHVLVTCPIK